MISAVCHHCGADLTPFEPIERGPLSIANPLAIRWNGELVRLTAQQRLIVLTLVRANGEPLRRIVLAEAAGSDEGINPDNLIAVQLTRINKAFRTIDMSFDQIEAVHGAGVRWRVE